MEKSTLEKSGVKMIVGLGNPSDEYKNTYHNAGQLFLDFYITKSQSPDKKYKTASGKAFEYLKLNNIILVKPLIFMNESGKAVSQAMKYFKLSPSNILIAHDDSDQTIGNFKFSFDQNSGGHNGIESTINCLNTKEFHRFKIGIRPTQEKTRKKAEEFVLKKISKKDEQILNKVFEDFYIETINN